MLEFAKRWSLGAKMVAISGMGLLLSQGLCAVGGGFIGKANDTVNTMSVLLFLLSIGGLFTGFVVWMIAGIARPKDR